ncbi:MAG: peptidoglycan DD-metalloendopeptidase family protein [Bacteroidia bacterium]
MSSLSIKNSSRILLAVVWMWALFGSGGAFAQKRKDLEKKRQQALQEIEETKKQLAEIKVNKNHSLTQLLMLNKKIAQREELIGVINSEIRELNKEIAENNSSIKGLQNDLAKLKAEYAKMIYYAYKNQDAYNRLMFVFASKDFEQAFMRLKYLQQYNVYRKKQADQILETKKKLDERVAQLEAKKSDQRQLLTSEQSEKQNLASEKKEKEQVFSDLKTQESKLKKDLEKKKKDAEKLQKAIQKVIQDELDKLNVEQKNTGKPKTDRLVLTPEAKELSNSFASNKNKLPWPVIKGDIVEHFGVHPHPVMQNVDVNNNGIDIATIKGAMARAVFDGEVKAVVSIPGSGQFILVRHGEYLTVYSNLKEIYVNVGDKVKTKQNIGSVLFDEEDSKTILHFEIWKGKDNKLDPESWITPRN